MVSKGYCGFSEGSEGFVEILMKLYWSLLLLVSACKLVYKVKKSRNPWVAACDGVPFPWIGGLEASQVGSNAKWRHIIQLLNDNRRVQTSILDYGVKKSETWRVKNVKLLRYTISISPYNYLTIPNLKCRARNRRSILSRRSRPILNYYAINPITTWRFGPTRRLCLIQPGVLGNLLATV